MPLYSQRYDHVPNHWWFERNSRLPRGTFDRPRSERIAEWAAVIMCALFLAGAIVLASYYL